MNLPKSSYFAYFFILQGLPGKEGREGEAGIPGCNGTKVSILQPRSQGVLTPYADHEAE